MKKEEEKELMEVKRSSLKENTDSKVLGIFSLKAKKNPSSSLIIDDSFTVTYMQ